MKGLDDLAIVSITHLGYLRFLVLVNTYSFFTEYEFTMFSVLHLHLVLRLVFGVCRHTKV